MVPYEIRNLARSIGTTLTRTSVRGKRAGREIPPMNGFAHRNPRINLPGCRETLRIGKARCRHSAVA